MSKKNYPLIRSVYLYLFSLVGLVLLVVGGIRFIDMGLKAFVFTKAEQEQRISLRNVQPPVISPVSKPGTFSVEEMEDLKENKELSEQERAIIEQWLADYKSWKEQQEQREEIDPIVAQRHRDASLNLAMIIIGLPLYLYHWAIIKKNKQQFIR